MKIKRLIIRNIASIEHGDINFENGLIDPFSGENTTLFLISGDTGSGKSAILDCISLTLYGTTPRVSSVSGQRSNKYISNGGEISVNSIRQYTRLGIGAKDECFAKLIFEGNDGKIYTSTYSLGMTSRGNFAKPQWTLDIENETSLENEKNVAPAIRAVIGLTYEQFSRMAMLSQGQFANFLIGGKEERERILEQLTSTERFSEYGKAISNIYKRKKQSKELLETTVAAESKHLLSEEREEQLRNKITTDQAHLNSMRDQIAFIDKVMNQSNIIRTAKENITKLDTQLSDLVKEQESESYKEKINLVDYWDATSSLRSLDAIISKTQSDIKDKSSQLTKWLVARKTKEIESQPDSIRKDNDGFNQNRSSAIEIAHTLISDYEDKLNALTETLSKSVGRNGILTLRKEASKANEVIGKINILIKDINSLEEIRSSIKESQCEEKRVALRLAEMIKQTEVSLKEMQEAKKIYDEASQRVMTMHLSLSENFSRLRMKLLEEEASICPLCGQEIGHPDNWKIDDSAFTVILSPLEDEKNLAARKLAECQDIHHQNIASLNKLKGELQASGEIISKNKRRLEKDEKNCSGRLKQFGIHSVDSKIEQLQNILKETSVKVSDLDSRIASADEIQKSIDELRKKDEPFVLKLKNLTSILSEQVNSFATLSAEMDVGLKELNFTYDRLHEIEAAENLIPEYRKLKEDLELKLSTYTSLRKAEIDKRVEAEKIILELGINIFEVNESELKEKKEILTTQNDALLKELGSDSAILEQNDANKKKYANLIKEMDKVREEYLRWNKLNSYFGGTKFRTLVQSHILRPLLANANKYLERITDHYTLTCDEDNEQLAILVLDRYNKNSVRSATILSGGERFMISLALSLALSSLNKADMNIDVLFIDEGFGTLDAASLTSVINTLRRLPEIAGQNGRRVGVISHREELADEIPVKIKVVRCGEGRSRIQTPKV